MKRQLMTLAVAAALSALALSGCAQASVGKVASLPSDFPIPSIAAMGDEASEGDELDGSSQPEPSGSSAGMPSSVVTPDGSAPSSGPSSSSGGGGGSDGSDSSSEPSKPAHEHGWTHHPAVYQDNPVYETRVVCSCGQQFGSVGAWDNHDSSLGFGNSHSYSVREVQVGTEQVLVTGEYWSCSCGATK